MWSQTKWDSVLEGKKLDRQKVGWKIKQRLICRNAEERSGGVGSRGRGALPPTSLGGGHEDVWPPTFHLASNIKLQTYDHQIKSLLN